DPHGNALGEPAVIMPFLFRETVAAIIGANPLLIAGDAAQRAAAALEQRPGTAVLGESAPSAVGALRAGLRLLRLGKAADAPRPPKSVRSASCRTIGGAALVRLFSTRYAARPGCGGQNASCLRWHQTTKRRAPYTPGEVLLSSVVVGITTAEQNGWSMRSYCE